MTAKYREKAKTGALKSMRQRKMEFRKAARAKKMDADEKLAKAKSAKVPQELATAGSK